MTWWELVLALLAIGVMVTFGMARWFKQQSDLDKRDEAEALEAMRREWGG